MRIGSSDDASDGPTDGWTDENTRDVNTKDGLSDELGRRIESLRKQGLYRRLRTVNSALGPHVEIDGVGLINFSSNDYLGLANHPALKEAAIQAVERYGAGSGASRLISGTFTPHLELEAALAHFKGTESALAFSSGYAAAVGTICALMGKGDTVIIDKQVHACVVDGARLCGATLRVFAHNDLDDLERILKRPRLETGGSGRMLVVTESVFSMDGDHAPLKELVALKARYGAWLMVDEAHATGLYGEQRRGLAEEAGVASQIEVQMGTLSKALGTSGGYICGSKTLTDYLINRARTFIFSTAPTPGSVAAATAALRLVQSPEGKQCQSALWERTTAVRAALASQGWPLHAERSPIIPLVIGAETDTVKMAEELPSRGIFLPAIRYPTVARGQARLRLSITANHTASDITALIQALEQAKVAPHRPS